MNYYEILGLDKQDKPTKQEIHAAYRKKMKMCHPDVGGDRDEYDKVEEAYKTLSDAEKRSYYDATGERKDELENRPELQIIVEVFEDMLRKNVPLHVNYVDTMISILKNTLLDVKSAHEGLNKDTKRYSKIMKKIKGSGKDSAVFRNVLLLKIKKNDLKVLGMNKLCVNIENALKVLKNFEFEVDEKSDVDEERGNAFTIHDVFKIFDSMANGSK